MDETRGAVAVIGVGIGKALHGSRVLSVPVGEEPSTVMAWLTKRVRWGTDRVVCVSLIADPAPDAITSAIDDYMARCAIDQNSVTGQAHAWGRHFCATLKRSPRWACNAGRQWEGFPVFIVGAGMGLDINGHLLVEAQKHGPIVAVNSSVGACLRHGVVPDLVVCLEALPLGSHLEPLRAHGVPVVLDAFSHPTNWDAADNVLAIAHHESSIVPHLVQLGVCPTPYLASSTCAAASLAIQWGADELILVGQNNATHDGRAYADGSPFDALAAEVVDDALRYSGGGKHAYDLPVVWRKAWGGGPDVPSDNTFDHVIEWHAMAARHTLITNATEQGAAIPGAMEQRLADVIAGLPVVPRWRLGDVPETSTAQTIAEMRAAAQSILDGEVIALDRFAIGALWTAAAALSVPPHERGDVQKIALAEAARAVMEYLR